MQANTTSQAQQKTNSGFTQRVITAIGFVAVMLASVYWSAISFTLIFGLIVALCLWELLSLFFPASDRGRKIIGLLLGLLPYTLIAISNLGWWQINTTQLLWAVPALLALLFVVELFRYASTPFQNIALQVLAAAYIGLPFALLHQIGFLDGEYYFGLVMGLMLMTWASDTGAYVVGVLIGKTPLMPRISPKKTWEGTLGGIVATVLAAWGLAALFPAMHFNDWMIIAGLVGIFGPIGDLVESMIKRSYAIKDSSNLLPGHGGVLDRFDAFLFMLPFVAVYLFLIR